MERNSSNLAWVLSFIWSAAFIWFFFAQEKKFDKMQKMESGLNTVFHKGDLLIASIFTDDFESYTENKKVLLAYIDFYKSDLRREKLANVSSERILYLLSEMEQLIYAMDHTGFPPPEVIQDDFLRINEQIFGIAQRSLATSINKAWMESFAILFFLIGLGIINYYVWIGKFPPLAIRSHRALSVG